MSNQGIWQQNTPYSKLLITVGIVLISAVFLTIIAIIIAMLRFHIGYDELQVLLSDVNNPEGLAALKLVQIISSIGIFITPSFIAAYLFSQDSRQYLLLKKKISVINIFLIVIFMLAAIPAINFLGKLNSRMILPSFLSWLEEWIKAKEHIANEFIEKILMNMDSTDLVINLFMMAVIPAVGEELLFRGVIQRIFSEWTKNIHWGIWISAALFSAIHIQFYGFLPRMLLGALLGYILVWSGSLWMSVLAHFVNNASIIIAVYLFSRGSMSFDPDKIGVGENSSGYLIAGTVIFLSLLYVFYRRLKTNEPDEHHFPV